MKTIHTAKCNLVNNDDNASEENDMGSKNSMTEERDFFVKLVEEVKVDPQALFEGDNIERLASLKNDNPGGYESVRERLKRDTEIRMGVLDSMVAREVSRTSTQSPTQTVSLVDISGREAEYFQTSDGVCYADVFINGIRHTYPIESKSFKRWLRRRYREEKGGLPNSESVSNAVGDILGEAEESRKRKIFTRVGHLDNRVYLDLADDSWRCVEVSSDSLKIIENPPVRFRRTPGMLPLPAPVGGSINELRSLLNISSEADFKSVVGFCHGFYMEDVTFPVLAIISEQGSGKTWTANVLRAILDPHVAPSRSLPRQEEGIYLAASNSRLSSYDNLSHIPLWASNAMCRICSGSSHSSRTHHTNDEETLIYAHSPFILNGISDIIQYNDLAERAIFLRLKPISEENLRSEAEMMKVFEDSRARILGALLHGVSISLKRRDKVKLSRHSRMEGFRKWVVAGETAFWGEGEFEKAYDENRMSIVRNIVETDVVADAVVCFMTDKTDWIGSPTNLLQELMNVAEDPRGLPKGANSLSQKLKPAVTFLRELGIDLKWQSRKIVIRKVGCQDLPVDHSDDTSSLVGNGHDTDADGIQLAQQPDGEGGHALVSGSGDAPDDLPVNENEPPQEVQEKVTTIRVGPDTRKIMLNFAGIHDNLHLKGNELKVRNVSGNILAFAGIAESFPEFGLEQARRFLLGMKRIKFSNPDWNFTSDRQLDVLENGGNFHWNGGDLDDESVFLKISKGMSEIPAPEMEFYMDRECIGKLKNACKKIDIKKLSIIGDGMHVSVGVSLEVDAKKCGLRNFALVLHPSTSKKFHFSFDVEILDKLLPRTDYNIGINLDGEGMLSFRRVSKGEANLIYYVDAEFHRDDKSANDIPASDSHDSTSLVGNGHGADNGGLDSEIHPAQQPDVEGNQALVNGSDDVFDENLPASEREQEPLPEVHEESVVMKVSEDTLKIMVNFAGIYKNLRLCGNELRIANEIRTIVAFADIPENFPEFKIERAKKFCQNVGKLSDPCWNFLTENGERGVYISKDRGSLHYNSAYLNDERMFLISMNRSVIPAPNILFNWEEKDIGKVKKMCKKLNIKKLSIVGDGEQISIGCKLEVSAIGGLSYYAHILHLSTEKINISFNTEILERLFPADYEIGFNTPPNLDGRGMLSFRRVSKGEANLIYYVITERHPDGEDTTDNFLVSGSIETPAKRCLPLVISHQPGDAVNIEQAIYHGDNLSILREMGTGTVDLIATDPPFNTGREWQGSSGAGFSDRWRWEDVREDWLNDIQRIEGLENYIAFVQKMSSSSAAFLCFMAVRLMEMGRVLKDNTGSIYLHCDQHAVCHLKMLMDGIFGKDKFCNMITWKRTTNKNHGNLKKFGRVCDYILFYAGSDNRISSKCQNLTDLWTDVPAVGSGKESTGYPTQKPVALYKRIIESSSNPGDVVLDPFVGSGTTLVAAKQLGRQWIGIDASEDACKVAQGRLMNLEETSLNNPADLPAPEADNITEEQQLREASEIRLPKSNEGNAQTDCENGNGDVQPVADPNPQDSGDVTPLHNVADVNLDKEDKQTETKDYYYDRILVTNDTGAVVRRIYLKHEDLPNNAFNWNDAKKDTGYVSECYVKNPPKSYFYHLPSDFYGVHLVAHGETLEALEIDKERVLDISNEFMLIADSCILDRWNSVSKELFKKEKLYWAFKADKNNLRCRFIGIINNRYVDSKFTANDLKYLGSQVNEFMQEQFSNYTEADIKKSRRNHRKAWKELNAWEAFMIEKPRSVFWEDILNEDKTSKSLSDVVVSLLAETCNLQGPDGSRPSTVHQKGKITLYTDPAQVPNHQDTFIAIPKQDVEFSNLPMPDTEETRKNRCDEMFEFIHREGFKMGKKKVGHYFLIVDEGLVIGIFHSLEEIYQYVKEGYPTADIERYKSFLSANGYPEDFHKLPPEVREEKINLNGSADLSAPEAGNIPKESRRNCA